LPDSKENFLFAILDIDKRKIRTVGNAIVTYSCDEHYSQEELSTKGRKKVDKA